jgi:sugar O-acyltransferase (sialic acid O-acetyltransferase NeuD family)
MGEILPCFVDDEFVSVETIPLSKFDPNEFEVMVTIADPIKRMKIVNKLPITTKFFTFIHPTSLILQNIKIGDGCFIGAMSILTTNIKIGNHCILNRANHIGHDTIIGDYFSAMPGSIVSGNCHLGNRVYLGTNSSIREKINVSSDVIIGLNSGVVKNINNPGKYGGVPCVKLN